MMRAKRAPPHTTALVAAREGRRGRSSPAAAFVVFKQHASLGSTLYDAALGLRRARDAARG
jgi:hypothetical protein